MGAAGSGVTTDNGDGSGTVPSGRLSPEDGGKSTAGNDDTPTDTRNGTDTTEYMIKNGAVVHSE